MNTMSISLDDLYHPPDEEYLPYQKAGIMDMVLRNNVLLGDEMGLGKTIQVFGYINLTKPSNILYICPNSLRYNVLGEANIWLAPELLEKYEIEMCHSGLFLPSNFVISSYEGLTRWSGVIKDWPWDLIILDEAHYIKNRSTKRAKAVYDLQHVKCKKIMMTGSPIMNYPYEIFTLIHFLDNEQWPEAAAFEADYGARGPGQFGYNLPKLQRLLREGTTVKIRNVVTKFRVKTDTPRDIHKFKCINCQGEVLFNTQDEAVRHVSDTHHEVEVQAARHTKLISEPYETFEVTEQKKPGLLIRRLKKEVLPELPRKRRQVIELPTEGLLLELVNKERALFERESQFTREMNDLLELSHDSTSESSFESFIENLRFTRKYLFEEMALIRHALAKAKIPFVIEHLENLLENKDKIICFFHHHDVGEAIYEHFKDKSVLVYGPQAVPVRQANVDKFKNDDSIELLIGSYKAAGTGYNMQVSSNVVMAELDWVPGTVTQAEDRAHRLGQEYSVLIQHLVAKDSMDSSMAKRIIAKQKSINKALNRGTGHEEVA